MNNNITSLQPEPVKLTVRSGIYNGATGFFRNRAFLDIFAHTISTLSENNLSIFMHACSVGPEPYSLAILNKLDSRLSDKKFNIHATDINPEFIQHAKNGVYPIKLLEGLTSQERLFTKQVVGSPGVFILDDSIKHIVTYEAAQSVLDYHPDEQQDVTCMMNVLCYLTPTEQHKAIMNAAEHTKHILCMTAFHPDSIADDIRDAGFEPVKNGQEDIHYGWKDRLYLENPPLPNEEHYAWRLGKFDPSRKDAAYRYGSIFKRK